MEPSANWPVLSYEEGKATFDTLHMWTQIVGKIKLATLPWINHSWHVTLHITPTGLSTLTLPFQNQHFQIDFDFNEHQLKVLTSQGKTRAFGLQGLSVADFYRKIFTSLTELHIDLKIKPVPVEIENAIPFEQDTQHASYIEAQVSNFHRALLCMQDVFTRFRAGFKGKCSPVHFFWGSFDLAYSRFCGRRAPKHPGGVPHLPDWVAQEAYSQEVISCGFWTGSEVLPEPAFYCYHYPEPEGFKSAKVQPVEAYYHKTLGEFVLPYKAVQASDNPDDRLLLFLESTYKAGASLAHWDILALEE
jgi:hypothetical protein